ncbi:MAG: hypothetical protein V7719_12940 [Psychroserpens sp.]|uniref:hypothetical protein n=1 Tax=Psychroserpens sp. TaxID=2020870 RepID=UPI0030019FED
MKVNYDKTVKVILQNKGTGPLILKDIKFNRANNNSNNSLIDFMPHLSDGYYLSTFTKASKVILRPSEEIILLEF